MPNACTFSIKPIGDMVRKYATESKVSVDPFARDVKVATYTNDLNPNTSAEHHMDGDEFLEWLAAQNIEADLVIIDPPYSPRQVKECYDSIGHKMQQGDALLGAVRKRRKQAIQKLQPVGGLTITCGWNSVGMGKTLGYEIVEILLCCHGSDHNDTIVVVERKVAA